MENKFIQIKGAKTNNLQDVNLNIPINKITCFAGVSGSGKTSLAFHTLYTESKRRFLNSFPTYLKFFSERPAPVDVESINPVLPVFGLPQINPIVGTRSTVADIMHVTELVQNLFYNHSEEYCPNHNIPLVYTSVEDSLLKFIESFEGDRFHVFITKHNFLTYFKETPFPSRSFSSQLNAFDEGDPYWEVARFKSDKLNKASKQINEYLVKGIDVYIATGDSDIIQKFQHKVTKSCEKGDYDGSDVLSPAYFTPYNAIGACSSCDGFGTNLEYDSAKLVDDEYSVTEGGVKILEYKRFAGHYYDLEAVLKRQKISVSTPIKTLPKKFWTILYEGYGEWVGLNYLFSYLESKKYKAPVRIFIRGIQKEVKCEVCDGTRLNDNVQNYKITKNTENYYDVLKSDISGLRSFIKNIKTNNKRKDFQKIVNKIEKILDCAVGIGIGHLDLRRKAKTVSAGEYQRLLLLKYLSYEGTGALFVFDEPSLGLNDEEKMKLLNGFKDLIKQGNTILIIDHSKFFHKNSDHFVWVGPGAGKYGGKIIFDGKYKDFKADKLDSLKLKSLPIPSKRKYISVKSPEVYGKKFKDFKIPIGELTWVTGKSGSGKSASMINVLANKLYHQAYADYLNVTRGNAKSITGSPEFDDVIVIDANLNRYSSRSTFGTMTELFTIVRKHFLNTPVAKSMALKDGHLSSNSQLGQCPKCEGKGFITIEMQFLEDITLECEDCKGLKLKPLYASLSDGKFSVHDAYSRPVHEILDHIKLTPKFARIYDYLKLLKLDYLSLDRLVMSLSGGERQRLYLLSKIQKNVENSIIFFENISFGLSEYELQSVSSLLQELVRKGNTIVVLDQDSFFEKVSQYRLQFN